MAGEGEGAVLDSIALYLEAFRFNEAGYQEMIRGPIMADLIRRAIRVEAFAKSGWNAPPGPPGGKPGVQPGRPCSQMRGSGVCAV